MTPLDDISTIDRKARMKLEPVHRRYRDVVERTLDFEECAICLTPEEAMAEAARCLHCPAPSACVEACPLGNDI